MWSDQSEFFSDFLIFFILTRPLSKNMKILSTTGSGSQSEYCKFFNIIKCGLLELLVL